MSAHLYLEGGGDSKEQHARCREGFRKLLDSCGFIGRMPRLTACGSRDAVFGDFETALSGAGAGTYFAMVVDSEDPVEEIESTWAHLKERDGWDKPAAAKDDQVLLMTTCMETWLVCDRAMLTSHYGHKLQESALPPLENLEKRPRNDVQDKLVHATRDCSNAYAKGNRSFQALAKLNPDALAERLPSFVRARRILNEKLH